MQRLRSHTNRKRCFSVKAGLETGSKGRRRASALAPTRLVLLVSFYSLVKHVKTMCEDVCRGRRARCEKSIRGPYGSPQRERIIASYIPFPLSKQLRFHNLQHAISQMITRTCYLQCLLGSLASEREEEAGDEARDEAGDEAGECRPEKNSRN